MIPTDILRCPETGRRLELHDDALTSAGGPRWGRTEGFWKLFRESEVRGTDRLLRHFYDGAPRLHDPAVRWLLPLLQGQSEESTRSGYWPLLDLERAPAGPEPLRILEVGVGSGVNLDGFAARVPSDRRLEVWGLDLSVGMLRLCRRRAAPRPDMQVHLLLADAHRLPFADATFDRVLHVGATGSFRDPRRALSEMGRVAKAGAPVVVVDEQLDPRARHGPLTRGVFRLLTFYDPAPSSPRGLLPPDAVDIDERQISRFYYALRFRRGANSRAN